MHWRKEKLNEPVSIVSDGGSVCYSYDTLKQGEGVVSITLRRHSPRIILEKE